MLKELKHYILHLRLHYQFFILSGGYLLGGLLADQMDTVQFWQQFINVHLLLFGGATAFNSYWDKDEGPIGGLKNPPKMTRWMHSVSLGFMFAGWAWAATIGWGYFLIFGLSLLLFWLYSTPHARWKGDPILSVAAIGVSTGTNSVLLGFWAAGGVFSWSIMLGVIGAGFMLLSLYPVSQVYQSEEDKKRGDITFFRRYGLKGVQRFFTVNFFSGLCLVSLSLFDFYRYPAMVLFILGLLTFFTLQRFVSNLKGSEIEYRDVMNIKLFASLSFVLFLLISNTIRYEWIGSTFLREYF